MGDAKALVKKQGALEKLKEALGPMRVLAVGVDRYDKDSGFHDLKTCSGDAQEVLQAYKDVHQLFGHEDHMVLVTTKIEGRRPSRTRILGELKRLADSAKPADRILFFFSGHGHRIPGLDKLFLVPEDAYKDDDPGALIEFDEVKSVLSASEAKQKYIILDACLSGPDATKFKKAPVKLTSKFFTEHLAKVTGVAVLSSCADDEASMTRSPSPNLSLYTHFLVKALRGDPGALNSDRHLTPSSLHDYLVIEVSKQAKSYHKEQTPAVYNAIEGYAVLGDFSAAIVYPESLDLGQAPAASVEFTDSESHRVKDTLTNIAKWTYSAEYLERIVNQELPDRMAEQLGKVAARVRTALSLRADQVTVERTCVQFPGGQYSVEFKGDPDDKKRGQLIHRVSLQPAWFDRADRIPDLLDAVKMVPSELTVVLNGFIKPMSAIPGLEAREWQITSQLLDKVEAQREGGYTLVFEPGAITFRGFAPSELFGKHAAQQPSLMVAAVLQLAGEVKK